MQKNAFGAANVHVEEVPAPRCGPSTVLLANRHSLISAGTESTAVRSSKRDIVRQSTTEWWVRTGASKMARSVRCILCCGPGRIVLRKRITSKARTLREIELNSREVSLILTGRIRRIAGRSHIRSEGRVRELGRTLRNIVVESGFFQVW